MLLVLAALALALTIITPWFPVWWSTGSQDDFIRLYVGEGVAEIAYGTVEDLTTNLRLRKLLLGPTPMTGAVRFERRCDLGGVTWDIVYGAMHGGGSGGKRLWRWRCGVRHVDDPPYRPPKQRIPLKPQVFNPLTINVEHQFRVPLWVAIATLGGYPCLSFFVGALRRAHRRKRGKCTKCGYDLTGLTGSRCPECFTVFDPTRPASSGHES